MTDKTFVALADGRSCPKGQNGVADLIAGDKITVRNSSYTKGLPVAKKPAKPSPRKPAKPAKAAKTKTPAEPAPAKAAAPVKADGSLNPAPMEQSAPVKAKLPPVPPRPVPPHQQFLSKGPKLQHMTKGRIFRHQGR